jgi:hypothetical protein
MRSPRSWAQRSPRSPPCAIDFGHRKVDHFGHRTCDLWGQTNAVPYGGHFDGEHHKRLRHSSKRLTEHISAADIDPVRTQPLGCNCITQFCIGGPDPALTAVVGSSHNNTTALGWRCQTPICPRYQGQFASTAPCFDSIQLVG